MFLKDKAMFCTNKKFYPDKIFKTPFNRIYLTRPRLLYLYNLNFFFSFFFCSRVDIRSVRRKDTLLFDWWIFHFQKGFIYFFPRPRLISLKINTSPFKLGYYSFCIFEIQFFPLYIEVKTSEIAKTAFIYNYLLFIKFISWFHSIFNLCKKILVSNYT